MNRIVVVLGLCCLALLPAGVLAQTGLTVQPLGFAPALVTQQEVADLEAKLMSEVQLNQTRQCLRPVLRGEVVPGRADDDVVAVIEGAGFVACFEYAREQNKALKAWLEAGGKGDGQGEGIPGELNSKCAGLPEAIQRAVKHEDACSPYLFGRRAMPSLVASMRAALVLAVQARLAGAEKREEAVALVLDGIRFFQDLGRGAGAPLISGVITAAAIDTLVRNALHPLLLAGATPAAMLAQWGKEVDLLRRFHLDFCGFLPYERYGIPLQLIVPQLKGSDWNPPGGFDKGSKPRSKSGSQAARGESWHEVGLSWVAMDRVHAKLHSACLLSPDPLQQIRSMQQLEESLSARAHAPVWARVVALLLSHDPLNNIREWVFDILGGIAMPSVGHYSVRYHLSTVLLQAARVHLQWLATSAAGGKCPADKRAASLLLEAAFKEVPATIPMQIQVTKGNVVLRPSAEFLAAMGESASKAEYSFPCN